MFKSHAGRKARSEAGGERERGKDRKEKVIVLVVTRGGIFVQGENCSVLLL